MVPVFTTELLSDEAADRLRADLDGYSWPAIEETLGGEAARAVRREQRLPALLAARAASAGSAEYRWIAVQARLFLLGDAVAYDEAVLALPELFDSPNLASAVLQEVDHPAAEEPTGGAGEGVREGFVPGYHGSPASGGGTQKRLVRARFQIVPIAIPAHLPARGSGMAPSRLLVASDWGELVGMLPTSDHVMPVGGATRTLAALADYRPGQRVLDIGTGCGIHAILAALCGARVTATDTSARALAYARFNARMAGVRLDLRQGSLLEPVLPSSGEQSDVQSDDVQSVGVQVEPELFDVVVSNPPFVITASAVRRQVVFSYRDGGMPGDSLQAELIGALPRVLRAGGRVWMLGNWEIRDEAAWDTGPRRWVEGLGLDAWFIQREYLEPCRYVEMWLRDGGLTTADREYEEAYAKWLTDFRDRDVVGIGMGYVLLGRPHSNLGTDQSPPAAALVSSDSADGMPLSAPATHEAPAAAWKKPWLRCEALGGPAPASLHDYTERIWAQRWLLDRSADELAVLRPQNNCVEHRLHIPGQSDPFLVKLAQTNGFAAEVEVTSAVAAVVGACDGELSLGVLCDAVADLLGEAAESVRAEVLPAVRELLALGMLTAWE
ncbi:MULTISPECIES: methyltransferase [unclassified Actinobaculum]|uniref:DUF7059 domain-containing protein n=1 Tax=unclassified Actinobaculum TaxID=2609299 RepID=UPI000F736837|nr:MULTISPECIES: methyltransferase [unclassified Actinobaculum]RTE49241.1 methyltransferase domain-containing protein [Actinobaculum sp. 352]